MIKSGFLIFIKFNHSFLGGKQGSNLAASLKTIIINNKKTLLKPDLELVNKNSLRFVMIKLGIIYKEKDIIQGAIQDFDRFDMKAANLMMQYILENANDSKVTMNTHDNFFLFFIKLTSRFLIGLYSRRAESIKFTKDTLHQEGLSNSSFSSLYSKDSSMKELILISTYLDRLRTLENTIFCKRNSNQKEKSIHQNRKSLKVLAKANLLNKLDHVYIKNQLLSGNYSNFVNFVDQSIFASLSKIKEFDWLKRSTLQSIIIELICYRLLVDNEQNNYDLVINILRKANMNVNLFLKNVLTKTTIRILRKYLIEHIKHADFCDEKEETAFSFIEYLESEYRHYSFSQVYKIKSGEAFNYSITNRKLESNCRYRLEEKAIEDSGFEKGVLREKSNAKQMMEGELTSEANIDLITKKLEEDSRKGKRYALPSFFEIFLKFFRTGEEDDFGMSKADYKRQPHFKACKLGQVISYIKSNFDFDKDDKNFIIKPYKDVSDCVLCLKKKKKSRYFSFFWEEDVVGYSNITLEQLKNFDLSHKTRIRFSNELKKGHCFPDFVFTDSVQAVIEFLADHLAENVLKKLIYELIKNKEFFKFYLGTSLKCNFYRKGSFEILLENNPFAKLNNKELKGQLEAYFIQNGVILGKTTKFTEEDVKLFIRNGVLSNYAYFYKEFTASEDIFKTIYSLKLAKLSDLSIKSELESSIDNLIINNDFNHYLLECFMSLNLVDPTRIKQMNNKMLGKWQNILVLLNLADFKNIFTVALLNMEASQPVSEVEESVLLDLSVLLYQKNTDVLDSKRNLPSLKDFDSVLSNPQAKKIGVAKIMSKLAKQPISKAQSPFTNDIQTEEQDCSLKRLIFQHFPLVKTFSNFPFDNKRNDKNIQDIELLLENGLLTEAFLLFQQNHLNARQLYELTSSLCLNNMLNYNVFSACFSFLLMTGMTEQSMLLNIRIESAFKIFLNELETFCSKQKIDFETSVEFLKHLRSKEYAELSLQNRRDILKMNAKITEEFKMLDSKDQKKREGVIFEVLKQLEQSIWKTPADGDNEYFGADTESDRQLYGNFCKIHNYQYSLTILHNLGRRGDWLNFLYTSQDHEYEPKIIYKILKGFFSNKNILSHLEILFSWMDPEEQKLEIKTEEINNDEHLLNESYQSKNPIHQNLSIDSIDDFLEMSVYSFRQQFLQKKTEAQFAGDPLTFVLKEDFSKIEELLHESVENGLKDLLFLYFYYSEKSFLRKFECLTAFLYISIKEILIEDSKIPSRLEDTVQRVQVLSLFEEKLKTIDVEDVLFMMEFCILTRNTAIIEEGMYLFEVNCSFTSFLKFCTFFEAKDFDEAVYHLFAFQSGVNSDYNPEEILGVAQNFEEVQTPFFRLIANKIVEKYLQIYDSDNFMVEKLLECLFLSNWSSVYSNYYKNLCALKQIGQFGYSNEFSEITEMLIKENQLDILSDFIQSYEMKDSSLLYTIFDQIAQYSRQKYLFRGKEHVEFWNLMEKSLVKAKLNNFSIGLFFAYVFECTELLYKEQILLIERILEFLNEIEPVDSFLLEFMRKEKGIELKSELDLNKIKFELNIRHKVLIYSILPKNKHLIANNQVKALFEAQLEDNPQLNSISFGNFRSKIWISASNSLENLAYDGQLTLHLTNACINLTNIGKTAEQKEICEFFKFEFEDITKLSSLVNFIADKYTKFTKFESLFALFKRGKRPSTRWCVDEIEESIADLLEECQSMKEQSLNILLKLAISVRLGYNLNTYMNFNANLERTVENLILGGESNIELLSSLNREIKDDELISRLLLKNHAAIEENGTVFKFVGVLYSPKVLGDLINRSFSADKLPFALLLVNYYCYLICCSKGDLLEYQVKIKEVLLKECISKKLNILFEKGVNRKIPQELFFSFMSMSENFSCSCKSSECFNEQMKFFSFSGNNRELGKIFLEMFNNYHKISLKKEKIAGEPVNPSLACINMLINAAYIFKGQMMIREYKKAYSLLDSIFVEKYKAFL